MTRGVLFMAFAASLGTIGTVNYSRENIAEKVLEITAGRGVDISFDQLGGDALTNSLSMMAPLGLVVLYNALLGAPSEDLFTALREHRGHIQRRTAHAANQKHLHSQEHYPMQCHKQKE